MRNLSRGACKYLMLIMIAMFSSCEWEADDGFNTSQGAGSNVNLGGQYTARSTELVAGLSVTSLLITHTGNSIEVRDNNNSLYTGSIGSPGVMDPDAGGTYTAGATMLQTQVYFEGENEDSDKKIEFTGTIRAVAATDVQATTTTVTVNDPEVTYQSVTTYNITDANTQYVLEGNWIEDGDVYLVDGFAKANAGSF